MILWHGDCRVKKALLLSIRCPSRLLGNLAFMFGSGVIGIRRNSVIVPIVFIQKPCNFF